MAVREEFFARHKAELTEKVAKIEEYVKALEARKEAHRKRAAAAKAELSMANESLASLRKDLDKKDKEITVRVGEEKKLRLSRTIKVT